MGLIDAPTDIQNIREAGAQARHNATIYVMLPMVFAVAASILFFDLSPSLLYIPLTAAFVTEYEARSHFCVLKGISPNEACPRPGLSRGMAVAVCLVSLVVAILISIAVAFAVGCKIDGLFLQQFIPCGFLWAGYTCER